MKYLHPIDSPIGAIDVAYALNIDHEELSKLTQGEKIQLLRMIHSSYLKPSEYIDEDE